MAPSVLILLAALPLRLDAEVGGGRFLTAPQTEVFGWVVPLNLRAGVALTRWLEPQLGASLMTASALTTAGGGTTFFLGGGFRLRPLAMLGGLGERAWLDAQLDGVITGSAGTARVGFEAALGFDVPIGAVLSLGPFLRYAHIVQPDALRDPSDALLLTFGLSVGLRWRGGEAQPVAPAPSAAPPAPAPAEQPPPPAETPTTTVRIKPAQDTDGDGIPDYRDKCPRTSEVFNGRDDADGCPDAELGAERVTAGPRSAEVVGHLALDASGRFDAQSALTLAALSSVLALHPAWQKISLSVECGLDAPDGYPDRLARALLQRLDDARTTALEPKRGKSPGCAVRFDED